MDRDTDSGLRLVCTGTSFQRLGQLALDTQAFNASSDDSNFITGNLRLVCVKCFYSDLLAPGHKFQLPQP